jgi:putative transposase
MTMPLRSRYAGYRFPPEVISHAIWLYFRFPLSLRMVEEMLAARGILVSHETVRRWALKFGQAFANQIRRRLPCAGDKWHLDEVVILSAKSGGLGKSGEGVYPCLGARQPVQPANHP